MNKVQKLKKWDIQDHLNTPEEVALYLEAVFEDGDPKLIAAALGDVARARGMTGITREALYKTLSERGDLKLATLLGVFKALGLRLSPRRRGEMKRNIVGRFDPAAQGVGPKGCFRQSG
ncbi:MAG: addiction module antidote protein [Hyphomicrobiales bacterium]